MKLNEVLTFDGKGFFSRFINPVWINELPDSEELDMYFLLNYGERKAGPVFTHFVNDGSISDGNMQVLSNMVYNHYKGSWEHIFKDYIAEYEPTHNTSFVETTKEHKEGDGSNTNTSNSKAVNSNSDVSSSHVLSTGSGSSDTNNDTYGFNSPDGNPVPADKAHNTSSTNAETTSNASTTTNGEVTTNSGDNGSYENKEDVTIEHRKDGNIGVTETVIMMEHDIDFWKWSFIDRICKDICNMVALSIY